MAEAHRFAMRVYYEDTDAAGIVYYANYLKFAERARTELLRELGFEHSALAARHGVVFAVRRCAADYLAPARLDDALAVDTRVRALRGAVIELEQIVRRGGEDLVRLELALACLARSGRPTRVPEEVAAAFAGSPYSEQSLMRKRN